MKKLASIDIGSNTVRLLIFETDGKGNYQEIDSDRVITRLGEGMNTEKRLLKRRMDTTLAVLIGFKERCLSYGPIPIYPVATSAVREAENRDEFLNLVRQNTGLEVNVISWEKEARLTLEGVLWKIPQVEKKMVIFDIGGGSTEFILAEGRNIAGFYGTSMGVVRLTEKFITQHPVDENEYRHLERHLRAELSSVKRRLSSFTPEVMIGTAGTATTLAALDGNIYPYDPEKIHGTLLPLERIQDIINDLKTKSLKERLLLKALERGREDLIIAGTAIVLETLRAFDCDRLTVSEYGLREGIILKALQ